MLKAEYCKLKLKPKGPLVFLLLHTRNGLLIFHSRKYSSFLKANPRTVFNSGIFFCSKQIWGFLFWALYNMRWKIQVRCKFSEKIRYKHFVLHPKTIMIEVVLIIGFWHRVLGFWRVQIKKKMGIECEGMIVILKKTKCWQ